MAIRMGPSDMKAINASAGIRSGPRLSSPIAAPPGSGTSGGLGSFIGDTATFNLAQWAPAFDLVLSRAITETTAIHVGGQGEMYYPFPLPAYGLYAGVSQYHRFGKFALGPTLTARGATDFGIGIQGGPGSIVGGEVGCSFVLADEKLPIAIIPYYGYHAVFTNAAVTPSHYAGAVVAMQSHYRNIYVEITAGFGRVIQPGVRSWNSPILGIRVGH